MVFRIVVATDGSEASDRMTACLNGLRRAGSRSAVLTHVFNVRDVGGAVWQALDRLVEALRQTPEWEEWEQAKAAFDQDAEVTTLRARLQDLGARWRRVRGGGRQITSSVCTKPHRP